MPNIPVVHIWNKEPSLPARQKRERAASWLFLGLSFLPVFLLLLVTAALLIKSWPLLEEYSLWELLSGVVWKPMKGLFGFWPFISGTFWVTVTATLLAVPPCILTALYLSEYARSSTRAFMKPLMDLLAAIPSVVYGVWGMIAIVPLVEDWIAPFMSSKFGWLPLFALNQPTGFGVLSGGIVLAVMITPFIISILYEVLAVVPQDLRKASLGIGATRWETIWHVLLPQIRPAILAAVVLGASRALGETMAVLMVVGNVPQTPTSIFDAAYPLPALIANNYGEMMSIPLYDAALLCAALILLVIIVVFNVLAALVLNRMLWVKRI